MNGNEHSNKNEIFWIVKKLKSFQKSHITFNNYQYQLTTPLEATNAT
jgi:hypothetical protein